MKKHDKNWLNEKNILIIGASSGIGKHLAFNLILKHNCNVLGVSNNEKQMENFYNKLNEFKTNFNYVIFDATNEKQWQDFAQSLTETKTQIDVLINCVGELPKFNSFNNYTQKDIIKTFNSNFYSSVFSIRYILPILKTSKTPTIINISCLSSLTSVGGTSIYSASKSALKSYTEIISAEVDDKFYVAMVHLGLIKTDFYKNQDEKVTKKLLNRAMTPNLASIKIIKKLLTKQKRIVVGLDALIFDGMSRIFPTKSIFWTKKWLNKKNIKLTKEMQKKQG